MSKYDQLKILKKTKSRTYHVCSSCGGTIIPGDLYYKEHIEDEFLHSLNAKKFCLLCYETKGDKLFARVFRN